MKTTKNYESPKCIFVYLNDSDVLLASKEGISWGEDKGEYGDLNYGGGGL
ncbi:MAG: hypothetical protein KBS91_02275 [Firmicutes bacterium]|nr:hypothetical protein [Candidatus Caballimonas caccae]